MLTELPPEYDPAEYRLSANGSIVSRETGRIVANPGGGKHAISPASSREIRSLWRAQKARSRLRGLVRGIKDADGKQIDVSDIDDELVLQANDAAEALTAHMVRTFMASKNLRGMGETYTKLLDIDDKDAETGGATGDSVRALVDLVRAIQDAAQVQPDVIDGQAVAVDNNYYRKHTDDVHIDSGQDSAGGAGGGADADDANV